MPDHKKLGALVCDLRKSQHLTQADLAADVGIASNTLAMFERGERALGLRNLNAVGRALGIPGSCLLLLGSSLDEQEDGPSRKLLASAQSLIRSLIRTRQAHRSTKTTAKRRARRPLAARA